MSLWTRMRCAWGHRWGDWRTIPGEVKATERDCLRCRHQKLILDGYTHEFDFPATSGRWKTQGFLTPFATGGEEAPYGPAYFPTRRAAERFAHDLRRDHGGGMIRVEVTRA